MYLWKEIKDIYYSFIKVKLDDLWYMEGILLLENLQLLWSNLLA